MKPQVEAVLDAAGIAYRRDDNGDGGGGNDSLRVMECWLGLNDANGDSGMEGCLTVEDCAPLPEDVYDAIAALLVAVYTPSSSSSTTTGTGNSSNFGGDSGADDATASNNGSSITPLLAQNLLFDSKLPPHEMSLEKVFDSFRATRWLCQLLDLNVDIGDDSNNSGRRSFVELLLAEGRQRGQGSSASSNSNRGGRVIHALYQHVQDLPRLQSQMHKYSQSLKQKQKPRQTNKPLECSPPPPSSILADPAGRLQQYEEAQKVASRLAGEFGAHVSRLQDVVGEAYRSSSPQQRKLCRRYMGTVWQQYVLNQTSTAASLRQENTQAAGIGLTLHVLYRILLGVPSEGELQQSHRQLLFQHLIPLHKPNALVLWRDQTCVLELYHEPLTRCVAVLLQKEPTLLCQTVTMLVHSDVFPQAGNTPKQVLLLHEIDSYIGLVGERVISAVSEQEEVKQQQQNGCDGDESNSSSNNPYMKSWMNALWTVLARCFASEHSRIAERSLEFFRNAVFQRLVQSDLERVLQVFLPSLVRRDPSWNPTVRKRTHIVLKQLQEYDPILFETASDKLFDSSSPFSSHSTPSGMPTSPMIESSATAATRNSIILTRSDSGPALPRDFSLKAGMGAWKPPSSQQHMSMPPPMARPPNQRPHHAPPLTVTGVAPWAASPTATPTSSLLSTASASAGVPPVTVTGVAPWAVQANSSVATGSRTTSTRNKCSLPQSHHQHKRRAQDALQSSGIAERPERASEETDKTTQKKSTSFGHAYVKAYMDKLKPPDSEEDQEGASSWSKSQMAETPTLLPDLKFHDLVFGHDLGAGAFGVVRYARLIDRNKTRSHWPEYAVKVIATEKIRQYGYEASVQREIAVLRILSHPGIARLVSSFRFKEGAYLVLEYASGSDLHNLLRKHGSLDHDSVRFVIGEVVAALASIHDMGLVYSDLKTENILITEPGHIKLTDFGGCRPVTESAKQTIRSVSKNILRDLRDGGWEKKTASSTSDHAVDEMDEDSTPGDVSMDPEDDEDSRIEGTTAYLPPEVVMGARPTLAADTWALGCVTYQCLSGRPPFLEADDEATRHKIVSFDVDAETSQSLSPATTEVDRLFEDKHSSDIDPAARMMIRSMLQRDPSRRPNMNQVAQSEFFEGTNVFSLHSQPAYPLDVGTVAPVPDAQWSRRQFSSIWAPQPVAYDLALPDANDSSRNSLGVGSSSSGPIEEGEEAQSFFGLSSLNKTNLPKVGLGRISEGAHS